MIERNGNPTRLHELLADRATQVLSETERSELAELLGHEDADDTFDWAAATLDLPVILSEAEPLPAALRARVENDAAAWLARSKGLAVTTQEPSRESAAAASRHGSTLLLTWMPWIAVAACLALALTAWWPTRTPDLAIERIALRAEPGTTVLTWNDAAGAGVTGDVMWNNRLQRGFCRFRGLAVNDPTALQYQLWMFDEARERYTENTAVDGGVFDVDSASGDVIVAIDPKLQVFEPKLFAITTEPPGGVVVHEDDPEKGYAIILTAAPDPQAPKTGSTDASAVTPIYRAVGSGKKCNR